MILMVFVVKKGRMYSESMCGLQIDKLKYARELESSTDVKYKKIEWMRRYEFECNNVKK